MKILFCCVECKRTYLIHEYRFKQRKTNLCKSCLIVQRNRTAEARERSRQIGKQSPSIEARERLRLAQKRRYEKNGTEGITGSGNPAWKGGTITNKSGYRLIRVDGHPRATKKGAYVQEHIIVMEKHLGRYLLPGEVIHHKNGNPADNRLDNLEIMSPSEHIKLHMQLRKAG